ncbi:MAG TPA: hypothetical protein VFK73_04860 [Paludibacter sp.]|nr:hypothetical protein [Paludibacter sp.]
MKNKLLFLLAVLTVNLVFGQQTEKIDYYNCLDKIEQISPVLKGKYERTCKGTLIEKGEFENSLKIGVWTTYSRTGKIIRKLNYENGLLNGKVELFYLNGKIKLTGEFDKGKKIGKWTYFTEKGPIFIEGNYVVNKPTGIWTINDKKGKKAVVQYDFDLKKYILNGQPSFYKDNDVFQNDNTEEWYILRMPNLNYSSKTAPLGGYKFANYMFIQLVEVPENFWDTYLYRKYKVSYSISADNDVACNTQLILDKYPDNQLECLYLIKTNPTEKIKKIEFTDFQLQLLDFKTKETLNLMPPWVFEEESEVDIYLHYVINQNIN